MSVKKLSFYLDSACITVRSDHLPLKRFLEKNTLNAKVNNWAVELELQKIDFVFIQGTKNMLADTLSRLIEIDDDIKLPAEQEGHEFGYVPFKQLPPAQVTVTEEVIINEVNNLKIKSQHINPVQKDLKIELPISNLKLKELQEQDRKINHLRKLWSKNKLNKNIFAMENDILKKKVIECGLLHKPVIIPEILRECLLILAHDEQGHNGFKRTHSALKTLYYWKGMKRHIQLYCRRCRTCAQHNIQTQELQKEHFSAPPQPMEFIAMDLIGKFHPASSKGKQVCTHSHMYADRFYILYTAKIQESRGCGNGLPKPHLLYIWTLQENTHRQRVRIQKPNVGRGIQATEDGTQSNTHLLTTV